MATAAAEGWRRRISLNPALFVEQERKSRSQSLATFKLSYYPKDADREPFDSLIRVKTTLATTSWAQVSLEFTLQTCFSAETYDEGMGVCGWILTFLSMLIVLLTFPLSICFCLKVLFFSLFQCHLGGTSFGRLCKSTSGPLFSGLADSSAVAQEDQVMLLLSTVA